MARIPAYKQKATQRIKLYTKLVKHTRKELKKENYILTYREAQKFVSANVYPSFKGKKAKDIKVRDVNFLVSKSVSYLREDLFFNPLKVPTDFMFSVEWWGINDLITDELRPFVSPQNLRVQVSAGFFGDTGVFEVDKYEYLSTGLSDIVEKVRIDVDNKSGPEWNATVVRREGYSDDGKSASYLLRYILFVDGKPVIDPALIQEYYAQTRPELSEEEEEELEQRRISGLGKSKDIKKKKDQFKKEKDIREKDRPGKKVKPEPPAPTTTPVSATSSESKADVVKSRVRELELLRQDFDAGIYDKNEYKAERTKITDFYDALLQKMEKGGIT